MAIALEQLGITRQDLINQAVEKLIEEMENTTDIVSDACSNLRVHARERLECRMQSEVDVLLRDEFARILEEKITPVNVWGEKAGEETTLRDAIRAQARVFWEVNVDSDGKPKAYGGEPRFKRLMKELLSKEFTAALQANAVEVVAAFRDAVKSDMHAAVAKHIDLLLPLKRN